MITVKALSKQKFLLLQQQTEKFDQEYYDYYGMAADNFIGDIQEIRFTKHGRYELIENTKKDMTVEYCWKCTGNSFDECRQEGVLEKVLIFPIMSQFHEKNIYINFVVQEGWNLSTVG